MSELVQSYLGFGVRLFFPLCPIPPSVFTFLNADKNPGWHSLAGHHCSQPATVHWVPTGCAASPWAPVWEANGPDILYPGSWLPTVLQGLGHSSSSRWMGLANRNQQYGVAWESRDLRGQRGKSFWCIEFQSMRGFVNSCSRWQKRASNMCSLYCYPCRVVGMPSLTHFVIDIIWKNIITIRDIPRQGGVLRLPGPAHLFSTLGNCFFHIHA